MAIGATLAAVVAGGFGTAEAFPFGYQFKISGDPNEPDFTLTNISDSASLIGFSLTIGDTTRNWDSVHSFTTINTSGAPLTASLLSPDQVNDGIRSDQIQMGFTGFDRGDSFTFSGDIDLDNSDTVEDYRTVLFSNGPSDNAVLSVTFSDPNAPVTLSLALSDQPLASSYTISQWQIPAQTVQDKIDQVNARRQAVAAAKKAAGHNQANLMLSPNLSPVPLPGTLPLMGGALAALALLRRKNAG